MNDLIKIIGNKPDLKYFGDLLVKADFNIFPEPIFIDINKYSLDFQKTTKYFVMSISFTQNKINVDIRCFAKPFKEWKKETGIDNLLFHYETSSRIENNNIKEAWKILLYDNYVFKCLNVK